MTETICTVIIDDEPNDVSALKLMLKEYCPNVHVKGCGGSVREGLKIIHKIKPDLVFLDIKLPDGLGFKLLEQLEERNFEVVFSTAYDHFALKAFQFAAIHYILKPVHPGDLQEAIDRLKEKKKTPVSEDSLEVIKDIYNNNIQRIILPSSDGFEIYDLEDIVRCEADGCYTKFFLHRGKSPVIVSSPISSYESILEDMNFFRVHHKHLVNLAHIKKYIKSKGGTIVFEDDSYVHVSERKKREFLKKLKSFLHSARF